MRRSASGHLAPALKAPPWAQWVLQHLSRPSSFWRLPHAWQLLTHQQAALLQPSLQQQGLQLRARHTQAQDNALHCLVHGEGLKAILPCPTCVGMHLMHTDVVRAGHHADSRLRWADLSARCASWYPSWHWQTGFLRDSQLCWSLHQCAPCTRQTTAIQCESTQGLHLMSTEAQDLTQHCSRSLG